jgi:hypothetical protein
VDGMTYQEAYKAMLVGAKIRHESWLFGKHIYMSVGNTFDEKDILFKRDTFRPAADGWEIYMELIHGEHYEKTNKSSGNEDFVNI